MNKKKQIISKWLDKIKPQFVCDLGANIGQFSRISSKKGINTISFDIDPAAVEKNFLECMSDKETKLLPLLLDLTNPSPGIGWANQERASLMERFPNDTILALAIIHHLVISNNLPLTKIVEFFKKNCINLIIEFIPKSDSQVQRLLSSREDIFEKYNKENFESEFKKSFLIHESVNLEDSKRTLYLMEKK